MRIELQCVCSTSEKWLLTVQRSNRKEEHIQTANMLRQSYRKSHESHGKRQRRCGNQLPRLPRRRVLEDDAVAPGKCCCGGGHDLRPPRRQDERPPRRSDGLRWHKSNGRWAVISRVQRRQPCQLLRSPADRLIITAIVRRSVHWRAAFID